MNILVTGASGQLGSELEKMHGNFPAHSFFFTDVDDLDITEITAIRKFVGKNSIQAMINCAAYTDVDGAECNQPAAFEINGQAVLHLAEACAEKNIRLIHISTDYVYSGFGHTPYSEDDSPSPVSVYGKTKYFGEKAALSIPKSVVLRTSWLYSAFGKNFVKTILRAGAEKDELNVVFDQTGTPTHAADLAQTVMHIVSQPDERLQTGLFNYSNEGVCSWYDFAYEIIKLSGLKCTVKPVETKDFPRPAPRPHYSVMNKARIRAAYGVEIPHWTDSLKRCLRELAG